MDYFQLSIFGAIVGTLSVILMYVYLYCLYRERYIGLWTISWIVFFSRVIFFDSKLFDWKDSILGAIIFHMLYVTALIIYIYATHLFINKPFKIYWLYGAALTVILGVTSTIMQLPVAYKIAPPAWFSCIGLLYIARTFINIKTRGVGKYITGGSFFLWCLLTFMSPFFLYSNKLQVVSLIGGILRILIASGTLIVYFEKTRADLITKEEHFGSLQQANRELDSFCHSVAHDLKGPLLSVNKLAEDLELECADKFNQDEHESIQYIKDKSAELVKISDHLLELSRMAQKQLKIEAIQLEPLFREVYDELIKLQPQRQVDFKLKQLPVIHGDPIMIKLLVRNILSNALKFTRNRQQASIEVATEEGESNYIISVKDNGAGFDMRYSSRLFGVFERLHADYEFEGTGVGLTISQKILKRHHGKAWLTGKVDEGAVFSFSFPKDMQKQHTWPILVAPDTASNT